MEQFENDNSKLFNPLKRFFTTPGLHCYFAKGTLVWLPLCLLMSLILGARGYGGPGGMGGSFPSLLVGIFLVFPCAVATSLLLFWLQIANRKGRRRTALGLILLFLLALMILSLGLFFYFAILFD